MAWTEKARAASAASRKAKAGPKKLGAKAAAYRKQGTHLMGPVTDQHMASANSTRFKGPKTKDSFQRKRRMLMKGARDMNPRTKFDSQGGQVMTSFTHAQRVAGVRRGMSLRNSNDPYKRHGGPDYGLNSTIKWAKQSPDTVVKAHAQDKRRKRASAKRKGNMRRAGATGNSWDAASWERHQRSKGIYKGYT